MAEQPVGPRCGNNPNARLPDGDRKAIENAKSLLALKAAAEPYIDSAAWVDGDPLMEVIAAIVWKHCEHSGSSLVIDDPRTIAAFAAAVARAHAAAAPPAADQAALRKRIAMTLARTKLRPPYLHCLVMADAVLPELPDAADRAALERVRTVLETEAVEGRSALEYRGLIASALMGGEAQQPDVCDTCDTERCETCHGCRCNKGDDNTCGHPDCPATRVKHSGPDTKFCVLCLSGEHERVGEEA